MFEMMPGCHWYATYDGDPRARWLYERHYSAVNLKARQRKRQSRNRNLIAGPGEKMVLLTNDGRALFVWRKFKGSDNQTGINCAVFRNEGAELSSMLILEAEQLALARWPGERLYTYINPRKIKSTNPGYCFIKAGWRKLPELTKANKLIILEKISNDI